MSPRTLAYLIGLLRDRKVTLFGQLEGTAEGSAFRISLVEELNRIEHMLAELAKEHTHGS